MSRPDDRVEREMAELLRRVEGPVSVPERTRRDVLVRMSAAFDAEMDSLRQDSDDDLIELAPMRHAPTTGRRFVSIGVVAAIALLVIGGTFMIVSTKANDAGTSTSATSPDKRASSELLSGLGGPFRLDKGSSWIYDVTASGEQAGTWQLERVSDNVYDVRMTWSPDDVAVSSFDGTFRQTGGTTSVPLAALLGNLTPPGCRDVIAIGVRGPEEPGTAGRIEAQCDDDRLTATGAAAWNGTESVTTPAGRFVAHRLDIELYGFDPLPLTVTMWFDPDVGLVAQELTGDDGTVLTRLDLVDATNP